MNLSGIDLNTLGTWALVLVTLLVAAITKRSVRVQQDAVGEQQKIARSQLSITLHMDMEERFERPAMLRERARLARLLMANATRDEIAEAVPNFFDSLAILYQLDYLLPDLTYNSFSFYATHWCAALRKWFTDERAAQPNDPTLYVEFQRFADKMLDTTARKLGTTRNAIEPTPELIRDFLEGEAMRGDAPSRAE